VLARHWVCSVLRAVRQDHVSRRARRFILGHERNQTTNRSTNSLTGVASSFF
jgi:hypothetical protein